MGHQYHQSTHPRKNSSASWRMRSGQVSSSLGRECQCRSPHCAGNSSMFILLCSKGQTWNENMTNRSIANRLSKSDRNQNCLYNQFDLVFFHCWKVIARRTTKFDMLWTTTIALHWGKQVKQQLRSFNANALWLHDSMTPCSLHFRKYVADTMSNSTHYGSKCPDLRVLAYWFAPEDRVETC